MSNIQELAAKRLDALHLRSISEGAFVNHIVEEIVKEILPEGAEVPHITSLGNVITLKVSSSLEAHMLFGKRLEILRNLYKRQLVKQKYIIKIMQKAEYLQNSPEFDTIL